MSPRTKLAARKRPAKLQAKPPADRAPAAVSPRGNTHGGRRVGAGRKTVAEELGLVDARRGLQDRLPRLGRNCTEGDVIEYLAVLDEAFMAGEIAPRDVDILQNGANLRLRAIRSRRADKDLDDLRRMKAEAEALDEQGREHESLDRQHLADDVPQREAAAPAGCPSPPGPGETLRPDVGAASGVAPRRKRGSAPG